MSKKVPLTVRRIADLSAPQGVQVFLWDSKTAGLGVRLKGNGKPVYVFQSLFAGKTVRMTIGDCAGRTLPQAAERARLLQIIIDDGRDPRAVKAETVAKDVSARKAQSKIHLTVGEVWPHYIDTNGMPNKVNGWSDAYKEDLEEMVAQPRLKKVGQGMTLPGPLCPLMAQPLQEMTPKLLRAWYINEALRGKAQATRALSMFSGFLEWTIAQDEYEDIVALNAAKHPKVQKVVFQPGAHRTNALQKGQLRAWFEAIDNADSKVMAAFLKTLLLTGARKESLCKIKWKDINFKWRVISVHDKNSKSVVRRREIPLLPFTASVINSLPRLPNNEYVFASDRGQGKHIVDARNAMAKILTEAEIRHCTMHDLRRTYSKLSETAGVPDGAIRQMMGQEPNTTGQKYTPREVDDLRDLVEVTERYIVSLAGIDFDFDSLDSH